MGLSMFGQAMQRRSSLLLLNQTVPTMREGFALFDGPLSKGNIYRPAPPPGLATDATGK